jgi:hypothetical protein
MIHPSKVVSIHPYFKVKPGKLEQAEAFLPQFIEKTAREKANLYYDFTTSGDAIFCREAYVGAQGSLDHVEHLGTVFGESLKIVDVLRVEVHGTRDELAKLKGPLSNLKPQWFEFACGVAR